MHGAGDGADGPAQGVQVLPGPLVTIDLQHDLVSVTCHVCHVSVPVCPDAPVRLAEVDHVPGQREVRVVRVGVAGQQLGAASKYFLVLQKYFHKTLLNIFLEPVLARGVGAHDADVVQQAGAGLLQRARHGSNEL